MATDKCHMEQVKSVPESTRSISRVAIAKEVGISPADVYHILTNSLGKQKVCAKWISHVLNDEPIASTHLQNWRNEGNAFLDRNVTADESWMHSFDPQLKQENAEWHAQMPPKKKLAQHS